MKGWDEAIEEKRLKVDHAKQTFESERDVDFSRLYCDDVETLKSYLLPEQSKILEEPVMANPWFREEAALKLNAIVSTGLCSKRCWEGGGRDPS